MPLIKKPGKAARSKNIATEVKSGRPVKQAAAIAYSVGRQASGKAAGASDPDEARYRAQDGLRTLQRAEEVHGDKELMGNIVKHAKDQHEVAKRASTMVKSAAISQRQADRMKGAAK